MIVNLKDDLISMISAAHLDKLWVSATRFLRVEIKVGIFQGNVHLKFELENHLFLARSVQNSVNSLNYIEHHIHDTNIHDMRREKERDLTQSCEKKPTPTEQSKKQRDNTKTPPSFDYITIADRLRQSVGVRAVTQLV